MSDSSSAPDLERLLDSPGRDLAETLYGPAWPSSLILEGGGRVRARGFPPARRLADLLEPVLSGVIAHDGRSPRSGRSLGWWDRSSGSWQESSPEDLAGLLSDDLDPVLAEARDRLAEERRSSLGSARAGRLPGVVAEALNDLGLRAECLRVASALVDSSPGWARVLAALRSRLRLQEDDLREIVREWLSWTADAEGWAPGDRLEPEALRSRYVEAYDGALPALTFARAVPLVLEQHKSGGSRFYVFPGLDSLEVAS